MDNQRLVERIQRATKDMFSMMLGMEASELAPYEEQGMTESFDGIVSLVGIGGPWTGMGTVYCGAELALQVTEKMLMTEQTEVNEEVLDAMAELANIIVGNVKTSLEADLGPLVLSIPTVIFGRNYKALNVMGRSRLVAPFVVDGLSFSVKFCLVPREARQSGRTSGMFHQLTSGNLA